MNKKIVRILLSLGLCFTAVLPVTGETLQVVTYAAEKYQLSFPTARYVNSDDALSGVGSVGDYEPGEYFIYRYAANGMINITRVPDEPGSWINPGVISVKEEVTVKDTEDKADISTESVVSETKSLEKAEIENSAETIVSEKPEDTVTTTSEEAGPETEPVPYTESETVSFMRTSLQSEDKTETYDLSYETDVYNSSEDAAKGKNPLKKYYPGKYHIYRTYNGMLNISRTPGVPGGWINPGVKTVSETVTSTKPAVVTTVTTKPLDTNPLTLSVPGAVTVAEKSASFYVRDSVTIYITAADALSGKNAAGRYGSGTYYVYKTHGQAVNITRVPGIPGAWINSSGTVSVPVTTTKPASVTTTKPVSVKTTTKPLTTVPVKTSPVEGKVSGKTIQLDSTVIRYGSYASAMQKKDSIGNYPAGTYYIFNEVEGMLNVSRTPGVPGSWINILSSGSAGTGTKAQTTTKPLSVKTTTKPVTTTTTKPVTKPAPSTVPEKARQSMADFASQFVGYNGDIFKKWYAIDDEWCNIFVSYVAEKTGNSDIVPKSAYVPGTLAHYKNQKEIKVKSDFKPEKDMLIIFDYEPNSIPNHIGIVTGADDRYVYTVEGNTGSWDNDRSVVSKYTYDLDDIDIMGYLVPNSIMKSVAGQMISTGAYLNRAVR